MPADHVACGDCERIRPGWVAQPVNTLSSLALVAVSVPVWRRARAVSERCWLAVAAASATAGVGSVAYHGPGGRLGKTVHDVGVAALAVTVAAALAEDGRGGGSWSAAPVAGAAAALHAASRSGGPLCRPDSRWQGHAAWHVLIAVAVLLAAPRRA